MADKLNDDEIVEELKRFGETVKVPIDRKRRPILIKKLNHYYAKENPPLKRGKSGGRQSKSRPAPAAEFSDDSQDETETANSFSHKSNHRNKSLNNLSKNDSPSKRNRQTNNRSFTRTPRSRDSLERGGKRKEYSLGPSSSHVEVYPDEFSDNDTADESVYVEEQSIGVNTSLNFDDTFNNEEVSPTISFPVRRRPDVRSSSKKQSPMRNVFVTRARQGDEEEKDLQGSNDHVISKTILITMTVFFAVLGLSYIYIRRDIFIPKEAAITELERWELGTAKIFNQILPSRDGSDLETQYDVKNSNETVNEALRTIAEWFKDLANRKGKFELGEIDEKDVRMSKEEVQSRLKKREPKGSFIELCFKLILEHPEWEIMVFTKSGADATEVGDVSYLESRYGDLSLVMRAYLALKKVLYGLALLLFCIGVCILGIFYLRWQNKKKEQEQFKVYEMVEKIIDILKENSELAERKNDQKNFPPYLAVQHVRDQLIPIARRKHMKQLWDEAVKFIETNESRIRVDTQVIHGEEFTVWRWLPAVPNGHKMWQGQAFGETSQNSVNVLPYGPTPCLKVRNMFDPNMEQTTDDWHLDIEENILQKCKEVNGILHIFVDRNSREHSYKKTATLIMMGCVYIKCDSCQKAFETYKALHGCWFDGRLVTVKYLRLEHYHDRFPDSRNRKYPLKPSDDEMTSVSKPYHKSALEMT